MSISLNVRLSKIELHIDFIDVDNLGEKSVESGVFILLLLHHSYSP